MQAQNMTINKTVKPTFFYGWVVVTDSALAVIATILVLLLRPTRMKEETK